MSQTTTMMSIHDDQIGEGMELAFPTMSSCAAIIAVTSEGLIGLHKTVGWNALKSLYFGMARDMIGHRLVSQLIVAGWHAGKADFHDIDQIRAELHLNDVYTTYCDYATGHNGKEDTFQPARKGLWKPRATACLCTFASLRTGMPQVSIKRSAKVRVARDPNNNEFQINVGRYNGDNRKAARCGVYESITTPSGHRHVLRPGQELKRYY